MSHHSLTFLNSEFISSSNDFRSLADANKLVSSANILKERTSEELVLFVINNLLLENCDILTSLQLIVIALGFLKRTKMEFLGVKAVMFVSKQK